MRRLSPLLVVLLLATSGTAHGHAAAGSLSPVPDANLITPPPTIRVVFGERVTATTGALRLVDAAGRQRTGAARLRGRELAAQVRGTLGPGRYAYAYVVTSADGHVLRRAVAFSVRSRTPSAKATAITLSRKRLRLSGAKVGLRTLSLWGGLREGTAEWRHPALDAPLTWTFRAGRARGLLPFAGTYRVTVRAVVDGFSERTVSGTVTIAG